MQQRAMDYVRNAVDRHPDLDGPVLEVGSLNINGTVRPIFSKSWALSQLSWRRHAPWSKRRPGHEG